MNSCDLCLDYDYIKVIIPSTQFKLCGGVEWKMIKCPVCNNES